MANEAIVRAQQTTKSILKKYESSLKAVLPKNISLERLNGIMYEAVRSKPDAMVRIFTTPAGQASFVSAVIRSAKVGLAPDGMVAAIVPRRIKNVWLANFEPMWKGLAVLAYNSGQVKAIRGDYVFSEDDWEHEDGLFVKLRHLKARKKNRGELIAAWCVVDTVWGGQIPKVVYEFDVDRARQGVTHSDNPYAAENMWSPEMWRKTAYKQALATAPMSDELRTAITSDDDGIATQMDGDEARIIDIDPVQIMAEEADEGAELNEQELAAQMAAEAGVRTNHTQEVPVEPTALPPKDPPKDEAHNENVEQAPQGLPSDKKNLKQQKRAEF
jgi:phage RecT family recombinase